jgi:hypothetical protein
LSASFSAVADTGKWPVKFAGHAKYFYVLTSYPDDSLFSDLIGSSGQDHQADVRLKFSTRQDDWDFKMDYQLIGVQGDTLELRTALNGGILPGRIINDDRRWFDLSHTIHEGDRSALVHRLDRISIGYTGTNTVVRFGRQAISWGNGMLFTAMDIFNPFDPAAVDKEYKTGDDMLYGQYLFSNGSDLQAVAVVRRDPFSGEIESDQSSLAVKYHGFAGMNEFDLLLSRHFHDTVFSIGGVMNAGGAVLRGDITVTDTDLDTYLSAVASLSYSWVLGGKNWTGVLEYYRNGFGQENGLYAPADLASNPDLLLRLERGEVFSLARNYLAASATIEMTPLFHLTPNIFINLDDPSLLAQFVASWDWKQDLQLLAAVNIPIGPPGSEYGGIESGVEDRFFSSGPSLFARLAWYF